MNAQQDSSSNRDVNAAEVPEASDPASATPTVDDSETFKATPQATPQATSRTTSQSAEEVNAAPDTGTREDPEAPTMAGDDPQDPAEADAPQAEAVEAEQVPFSEFGLPPQLSRAIEELGYKFCTPIQAETLPHSLSNYDVTGQAQTGTGKTAAFLITLISHQLEFPLDKAPSPGTPRALVLAPTRELVLQIAEDARDLTRHAGLRVLDVVGGMDFERQRRILENERVDILVATPGRLIDFLTRGKLNLRHVEQLVLDEADRMLSMGFIPDVRRIIRHTPQKRQRQTLLFSATFNEDVLRLAEQWTLEPVHVIIEPDSVAVDSIEQKIFLVSATDKFALLYNLMNDLDLDRVLVFANRRDTTRHIYERLKALGVPTDMLSGEIPQSRRLSTLERFREGKIRVLVATDVAGRGLHVEGISHVINYDLPEDAEDYVHRIGRTGRAGAKGISISFLGESDAFLLPEIEALLGCKLNCTQPEDALLEAPTEAKGASRMPPRKRDTGRPSGGRRR